MFKIRSEVQTNRRRKLSLRLLSILALLVTAETIAQYKFGLGHPPLFQSDEASKYSLKPRQLLMRFGNRVFINSMGMRSDEISLTPNPGQLRVLFLGDSVLWGGTYQDQSTTIPYLVQELIPTIEALNPSCGGWSPANELGWLKKHGSYASRAAVLVFNDGDLFQLETPDITHSHPSFPRTPPKSGIQELFQRYLLPRLFSIRTSDPGSEDVTESEAVAKSVRSSISEEIILLQQIGINPVVVFWPNRSDKRPSQPTIKARKMLKQLVEASGCKFVMADFAYLGDYFDSVHPSPQGNRNIAEAIAEELKAIAQ